MGVDPGVSGAIALIDPMRGLVVDVFDFPKTIWGSRHRPIIDAANLALKLGDLVDDVAFAVVEDVHAMPGQGVTSMFGFGVSKGLILGMLSMGLVPVVHVRPAVWKGAFGLNRDKNASIELATKKYPDAVNFWLRKKDDGRAEAVLLADFGKRFY